MTNVKKTLVIQDQNLPRNDYGTIIKSIIITYKELNRRGGVQVERLPRMREIGVRPRSRQT